MEMVARDLKAMGRYFCGSLSMGACPESGLSVEYREVVHHLTDHQREMYDNMARAWQAILQKTEKALALTNSEKFLRRFVVDNFWAEHQRYTKQRLKLSRTIFRKFRVLSVSVCSLLRGEDL